MRRYKKKTHKQEERTENHVDNIMLKEMGEIEANIYIYIYLYIVICGSIDRLHNCNELCTQ